MSLSLKTWTLITTVVFITFLLTDAIQEKLKRKFVKGKAVLHSYRTIQSFSKQQCLAKCIEDSRHEMCRIAGYSKITRTCQLSLDRNSDVLDVDNDETGVFFVIGKDGIVSAFICFPTRQHMYAELIMKKLYNQLIQRFT